MVIFKKKKKTTFFLTELFVTSAATWQLFVDAIYTKVYKQRYFNISLKGTF